MPDRSVASRMTSEAMPESIQDLAVSMPTLLEAHVAETDMAGPWNSNSFMNMAITVDGIMCSQLRSLRRVPAKSPSWR